MQERVQELLECLPYCPDLALSDCHLFGLLRSHLDGKDFAYDEEVETEIWKWPDNSQKTSMLWVSMHW
jgi:hypothetical protein